jgi:hypothetical protein
VEQVLGWADAHFARLGEWPRHDSGPVHDVPEETWAAVDQALKQGRRGFPGGSSLAQLIKEQRRGSPLEVALRLDQPRARRKLRKSARQRKRTTPLTEEQILAWADAYFERHGRWPTLKAGPVEAAPEEKWSAVHTALQQGHRGLPGGSSLARLLAQHRGVRNRKGLPSYTEEQILHWADVYHERMNGWPTAHSGSIPEAPGETWKAVNQALLQGNRGLPGGSSLAQLLARHRQVRNQVNIPPLTEEQILAWADAYHAATGRWPTTGSGSIPGLDSETWAAVSSALRTGSRGLPGGSSLARLLAARRGVPNHLDLPPLTEEQILAWADAYRARTGKWPTGYSGLIDNAPGESWAGVRGALRDGHRGLPGGSSLARLLAEQRGARNHMALPPLTEEQILAWADAYHARTGSWPTEKSGPVADAPGETWSRIDTALVAGNRGLPGGSSLPQLLARHRQVRNLSDLAPLSVDQILAWADAWYARVGSWPKKNSGPVPEAPGETWAVIDAALNQGYRSLPGGSSLARLLAEQRGARNHLNLPPLTEEQILAWADTYHERHGRWPQVRSGLIDGVPGQTWVGVDVALTQGRRGLPGGSSLARLLREHGRRDRERRT